MQERTSELLPVVGHKHQRLALIKDYQFLVHSTNQTSLGALQDLHSAGSQPEPTNRPAAEIESWKSTGAKMWPFALAAI